MKLRITCLLLFAFLGAACAQVFSMGNCNPHVQTMKNFDKNKYSGRWFEIKRSPNIPEEHTKCYEINFRISDDKIYDIESSVVLKDKPGDRIQLNYSAYDTDVNNGKLKINPALIADEQPFLILDTDYENYSIIYSCSDSHRGKLEYVWINSRTSKPNPKFIKQADDFLVKNNINVKLISEKHDC